MAIEIVSCPIKNGGSFQFVMLARLPGRVLLLYWLTGSRAPPASHGLREPPRSGRDPGNTPPAPLVAAPPDAISRMAKEPGL